MVRRALLLWFGLLTLSLYGQQFYFDQFSVSDGLAQSTVYIVMQDRNDVYWLGTQAGATRFDGVQFLNYSTADGMAENGVRAICEDQQGKIWFGHTGGGITVYDGNSFSKITPFSEPLTATVTSIFRDSSDHLWFTTSGAGVINLSNPDAPKDQYEFEQYAGDKLSGEVYGHFLDHEGGIYFVTKQGVKLFNADSSLFRNLSLHGVPQFYQTTSILVDRRGRTWIGKYHGGLYRYNPNFDSTVMYDLVKAGLSSNWVSSLFEDSEGNIWVGTFEDGVVRIDTDDQMHLYSKKNGFPGMKVWSIMEDAEGNMLFGTNENGLCVYKGDAFSSYFKEDGLIGSQVGSILQRADGSFWFGTNEGISILDPEHLGGSIHDFRALAGEQINFLKEDRQGTVWIGTMNSGVASFSRTRGYIQAQGLNRYINLNQVTAMELDKDNHLWVGTLEGLVMYDIEADTAIKYTQGDGLLGNVVSALYVDGKKRVWIGSEGRGVTLMRTGKLWPVYLGFEFTPSAFMEDQEGALWIGTMTRGVICFDPERNLVKQIYTVEEGGLLANLIHLVNLDQYNNIYLGTNKGLNIYNREEGRFFSYTSRSGFVGIETKPGASIVDQAGSLWFGTVKGVTRYHPSREVPVAGSPSIQITGMQVNQLSVGMNQGMRLTYRQNSIIFEYGVITLNPDEVRYQIMLEGIDQDWRPPGQQTRVNYPALPHGKYTFLVRARSSTGVWNEEPASFRFEIRPPFYMTWYFILSMLLVLGIIFLSYIKIREKALKRENIILEERVKDRTAIVMAQKEELTRKNKDITDSIRYAKRIQFAILPENSPFPDTFILFKPKDIVSGDFYWFTEVGDKEFFSAVDCTGHGVPGAFMSIIGHNSLTKIVREYGILEPGKILNQLNKEVVNTLHTRSDSRDIYDGMDLALVAYDRKEKYLEYSGAFNPLYLVRNGEILETKADKQSIGRSGFNTDMVFKTHRIDIEPGDTVYLFSDGYADQFGGELMKKFKYKNLKETILKVQAESMLQQRVILDNTIEKWRGDLDQLDDILVIGRRF